MLTRAVYERVVEAREAILEYLKYKESLEFSPRLEMRAIQLACAMSLLSYFREDKKHIDNDNYALAKKLAQASSQPRKELWWCTKFRKGHHNCSRPISHPFARLNLLILKNHSLPAKNGE